MLYPLEFGNSRINPLNRGIYPHGGIRGDTGKTDMQLTGISASLLGVTINNLQTRSFEASLLEWLQSCLSFDGLTTIAYVQNQNPLALFLWSSSAQTHSLLESAYLDKAFQLDPLYDLHVQNSPGGVYRLKDVAPDQFHRTQYYKEYFRFTDVIDEVGMLFRPAAGTTVIISLNRDKSTGRRFSQKELEIIATLYPVVAALTQDHYVYLDAGEKKDQQPVHTAMMSALKTKHDISLSPRQAQVALLVLKGHSSTSIGAHLGISPQTVKVFRKQIYKRCNISSQAELFKLLLPLMVL